MLVTVEQKAQGWRALVVITTDEGYDEALLFIGRSSTQVRAGYTDAFAKHFTDDEKSRVSHIRLQQWQGAPDSGKWHDKAELRLPTPVAAKLAKVAA